MIDTWRGYFTFLITLYLISKIQDNSMERFIILISQICIGGIN